MLLCGHHFRQKRPGNIGEKGSREPSVTFLQATVSYSMRKFDSGRNKDHGKEHEMSVN